MRIIEHLLEIPGDYNGDRIVDSADYFAWRSAAGTVGTSTADGNHDGVVDGNDYIVWRKAMSAIATGSGSGSTQLLSTVPEPTSAILLAVAMMGWGLHPRRRCRIRGPSGILNQPQRAVASIRLRPLRSTVADVIKALATPSSSQS